MIYLDADVLLALIKDKDFNKPYALLVLESKEEKSTSTITLLELEIVLKREAGNDASINFMNAIKNLINNLKIFEFNSSHFEKSLLLREKHGLGIFDSIHAAICLTEGLKMASTDRAYNLVSGLKRV